ncbi:hypothetical protein SAMN05216559_1372 [Halomicrobium zhouii]|uniref:Uncharacterized protein n=1 Tax=Halomicrobium zhouii TaxID=767519 RepID=A0A1I6KS81_9EURY|nr:hypothetical protein [Halomicrobium zhouii]SFR93780.1 hypothetical protein SAMN05216559_1372 [Halomicrobium zhouii]
MPQISAQGVEQGDDYYHVTYRDPDEFDEIRTPDWAANVAGSVVEGGEVRTGDEHGNEDWTAQSVLIPIDGVADEDEARDKADQIIEKMES